MHDHSLYKVYILKPDHHFSRSMSEDVGASSYQHWSCVFCKGSAFLWRHRSAAWCNWLIGKLGHIDHALTTPTIKLAASA